MTIANLCLAACITASICHAPPGECHRLPPLPTWATQQWIHDAAGIVAGETVPHCAECDSWVACTIVEDVTKRGYHPWRLRPGPAPVCRATGRRAPAGGRWHGWREPRERHREAIEDALRGKCENAPVCAFLGSLRDYTGYWRYGLASERQVLAIGNGYGVLACVPEAYHVQQ